MATGTHATSTDKTLQGYRVEVIEVKQDGEWGFLRVEFFETNGDAAKYRNDINNGIPHEIAMKNVARKVRARENVKRRQ